MAKGSNRQHNRRISLARKEGRPRKASILLWLRRQPAVIRHDVTPGKKRKQRAGSRVRHGFKEEFQIFKRLQPIGLVVVDGGCAIKEGTHDKLLEKKGKYYDMWNQCRQFSRKLTKADKKH